MCVRVRVCAQAQARVLTCMCVCVCVRVRVRVCVEMYCIDTKIYLFSITFDLLLYCNGTS